MGEENAVAGGNAGRTLTYGEKAVGLTFNPGGNEKVNEIKKSFASIIDFLNEERNKSPERGEEARMLSKAITEAQTAQMWAVKAVTWQF